MLTTLQFERTQRLACSLAGIELVERHRELLERRFRRFGFLAERGLDALLEAAEQGEATAAERMLCVVTTKFTGFFRNRRHFEVAGEHAVRAAHRRGQARLWSAATATGEEAYSLALAMIEEYLGKAGHLFTPHSGGVYSRRPANCPPAGVKRGVVVSSVGDFNA